MTQLTPYKVYSPNDLIKDSGYWDYLQYLQLNRINFQTTTIFDNRSEASNKLLNLISSVDTLEFLCKSKLKNSQEKREEFNKQKPVEFKKMLENTNLIRQYIEGDAYSQLQIKLKITKWLESLDPLLGSMKRIKRVNVVAGVGVGSETEDPSDITE